MKRSIFVCVLGALVAQSALLVAQPRVAPADQARQLYVRGQQIQPSAPIEAAQLYLAAYSYVPNCDLLFNAGVAFEQGRRYDDARTYFARYLASTDTCVSLQDPSGVRGAREHLHHTISVLAQEIQSRDPRRAAALYLEAYATIPDCDSLFSAALAFEQGNQWESARLQYIRYLSSPMTACTSLRPATNGAPSSMTVMARDHLRIVEARLNPTGPAQTHPGPGPALVTRYQMVRPNPSPAMYGLWIGGGVVAGFGLYSLVMGIRDSVLANDPANDDPARHGRAASLAYVGAGLGLAIGGVAIAYGTYLRLHQPMRRVPIVSLNVGQQSFGASAAFSF